MIHSARSAYAIFGSEPRDSPPAVSAHCNTSHFVSRRYPAKYLFGSGGSRSPEPPRCDRRGRRGLFQANAPVGLDVPTGSGSIEVRAHRARCRGSRDNAQRRARYRIAPAYPEERKGHPLGRVDGGSGDAPARVHRLCIDRACRDQAVRANTGSGHVNVESVHGPVTRRDRLGFRYHLANQRRDSRTHRLGTHGAG